MSFIASIEAFRKAITIYNFCSKFIFAAEDVVVQIGSNELSAAKQSLYDMRLSNSPHRELQMAITQSRSALQHFDSKRHSLLCGLTAMEKSYQTAIFISLCYFSEGEQVLCEKYRNLSCDYFSEWLDNYHPPEGKLYAQQLRYDLVKQRVNEIGLSWPYSYPDSVSWNPFSSIDSDNLKKAYEKHKEAVKNQYKALTYRLITK